MNIHDLLANLEEIKPVESRVARYGEKKKLKNRVANYFYASTKFKAREARR